MARGRIEVPLRVSSSLRKGAKYQYRTQTPDQFTKKFEQDVRIEYAESKEVQDWLPASPWKLIGNSLDFVLSMEGDLFC